MKKIVQKLFKVLASIKIKRDYILIMDNLWESHANIQDNFTFFQYIKDNKKSNLTPFYIINENSPYYKILKKQYKKSIIKYSEKNCLTMYINLFLILPKLRYVIDSFQSVNIFKHNFAKIIKESKNITLIFTQHGITFFKPDYINENIYGKNIYDKVIVSNEFEKFLFMDRGKFNNGDIIENGLFRWDKIADTSTNQVQKSIFLFFTTRRYLSKIANIEQSLYVKSIKKIIQSIYQSNILKTNNLKLKLGIHHSIAHIFSDFYFNNDIEIVSEEGIAKVKNEASLLITDYSSMCFEFFIQNKPVIFYQLNDIEDCKRTTPELDLENPYKGKEDKLFNICKQEQEVVDIIRNYIDSDFELSKRQQKQVSSFFYYKNNFCKRFHDYLILNK